MQQADFQRFKAVMNGMAKLYERELDPAVLDAYWLALRDWDLSEFESAAGQLMQTSRFMPKPAEFHELRMAGRQTAGEAWEEIRAMARSSYSGEPEDPVAARALRALGGLRTVAMCDSDKVHFLERRFAEHYQQMSDAEDIREALPQIAHSGERRKLNGPQSAVGLLGRLVNGK